ncbi:MAG: serpin family protein [Polyangiaceae bacterium]
MSASSGSGTRTSSASAPKPKPPASTTAPTASAPVSAPPPVATVATTAKPPARAGEMAKSSNAFGLDLFQKLRTTSPANLTFSPTSISAALAMTWGGAGGVTADEMKKVLHIEGSQADGVTAMGGLLNWVGAPNQPLTVRVANRLFGAKSYPFNPTYLETTRTAFGAPLEVMDFQGDASGARTRINGWVEDQTEKRIRDLLPEDAVQPDTRLVLVNAVYFLGKWASPFEKEATSDQPFSVLGGAKKNVPTMHKLDTYGYAEVDGTQIARMPFKGNGYAMYILLPKDEASLAKLEASLTGDSLGEMLKKTTDQNVSIALPKFELAPPNAMELSGPLATLGMPSAFDSKTADFSLMSENAKNGALVVSHVLHKAFVKVDEEGTEAAAATAVVMGDGAAMPPQAKEFIADHPFLFVLREETTGLVLFMGRVADPSR